MSYMNSSCAFAPAEEVRELRNEELDAVDGGIVPMIVVAYYSIGIAATALAAGTAFVAGAQLGYAANRN